MQRRKVYSLFITLVLLTGSVWAQQPTKKDKNQTATQASAPTGPVTGSGTPGHLAAWGGVSGSNTYVLTDSNIFTDKFGKIGIGTTAPTSLLTVQGMIETTLGGIKFPDGTVQTSSAAGALFTVNHDATLTGDGTAASPLGLTLPIIIGPTSGPPNGGEGLIQLTSEIVTGTALRAKAGTGGSAIQATGGTGILFAGGAGLVAFGGGTIDLGTAGTGGPGVNANGGNGVGAGNSAGNGITATAGVGFGGAANGRAGRFFGSVSIENLPFPGIPGNLAVAGTLSKGAGTFKIDHPLDPENKYLYHSFVESPDMMNIYNGNVTTDDSGAAVVTLPDYFEALNRDFRYQLTVIGTFAQAIVAEKVKDNRFTIKTNAPNVEVSWQVTGVRHDAFANKNRIQVEVEKTDQERGFYLHPDAFNQPDEKSVTWAIDPEGMKQRRQAVEPMRKAKPEQR